MNNLDKPNYLNSVSGEDDKKYDNPKENGVINQKLPLEIFKEALSYLNGWNMQQANLVSHLWSLASVDTAKRQEYSAIADFANFLGDNLKGDAYAIQREQLYGIGRDKKILDSVDLIQVRSSIYELRENILKILKNLKEDDLDKLEQLSKNKTRPEFFEHIFTLARIFKAVDEANLLPSKREKTEAFYELSNALLDLGCIDDAREIANQIPHKTERMDVHSKISNALVDLGHIDKAIEVANLIPYAKQKGLVLYRTIRIGIKEGHMDMDKAIEIVNQIPSGVEKEYALWGISMALTESGGSLIDKAIEIVNQFSSQDIRVIALKYMSGVLIKMGNMDKAIEIANQMPSEKEKESIFNEITLALIMSGNMDKAIEVANQMPSEKGKQRAFRDIEKAQAKM